MATDREVQAWHQEWREVFEDMGGSEILVVLLRLGVELSRRHWLVGRYGETWLAMVGAVESHYEADRLTTKLEEDIPF